MRSVMSGYVAKSLLAWATTCASGNVLAIISSAGKALLAACALAMPASNTTTSHAKRGPPVKATRDNVMSGYALQYRGNTLAEADAHRRQAEIRVLVPHDVRQRTGNAGAGCAQRVAQCDRAATNVDDILAVSEIQFLQYGQALCRKRLVEFD